MDIEHMDKLEEKVKHLVDSLKQAKEENQKLHAQVESLKKQSSSNDQERNQIKDKVEKLIQLIDSIEK